MTKKNKFLVIMLLSIISSFFLIEMYGKTLNKQLQNYVNIESERIIKNVVSSSINELLEKNLSEDLFVIKKNSRDEIELLDYNTKEVNRILKEINKSIQLKLLDLEEGNIENYIIAETFKGSKFRNIKSGVICEIPLGTLKKNALLSNFGPNIPIKMSFLGSVTSNINTKITPYGFNSLVIEVSLQTEIKQTITMPISSKTKTTKITSPLTIKVIQGLIPEYYYKNGLEKGTTQVKTTISQNY